MTPLESPPSQITSLSEQKPTSLLWPTRPPITLTSSLATPFPTTIALCLSPHLSSLLKCHLICEAFLGQPLFIYLLSGRAVQLAGSSFPEQGLNVGPSSESVES